MKTVFLLMILTSLVALGRFMVPGHPLSLPGSYEAGAHIWVGVLLAMSILCWDHNLGKLALAMLLALTILETVMFLMKS